jgi:hypothetical protein
MKGFCERVLDIREFVTAPGGSECARASTLRIELTS